MSEQLLDLLKLCLLALLYLFFLRVLWAVATQLRTPAVVEGERRGRRAHRPRAASRAGTTIPLPPREPRQLIIRAPQDLAGVSVTLADNVTFGRAPGCTVVLEDTFVSQTHGRIYRGDAGWFFEDLGSTNGTAHNGTRLTAPALLKIGDRIELGDTVLEAQ